MADHLKVVFVNRIHNYCIQNTMFSIKIAKKYLKYRLITDIFHINILHFL